MPVPIGRDLEQGATPMILAQLDFSLFLAGLSGFLDTWDPTRVDWQEFRKKAGQGIAAGYPDAPQVLKDFDFLEVHLLAKEWLQSDRVSRSVCPPILPRGLELIGLLDKLFPPDLIVGAIQAWGELGPFVQNRLICEKSPIKRQLLLIVWYGLALLALVEERSADPDRLWRAMSELLDALIDGLTVLEGEQKNENRHRRRAQAAKAGRSQSPELQECKNLVFREVEKIRKRCPTRTANALGIQINTKFSDNPKLAAAVDHASLSWDRFPATVADWVRLADKAGGFKNLPR